MVLKRNYYKNTYSSSNSVLTYSWCPCWAAKCRGSSPELVGLLASAFLVNSNATISLWPFLLASCSAVTPSHVCMFTSAPRIDNLMLNILNVDQSKEKYALQSFTFVHKVTQCPRLAPLSCYSERCGAVGVWWIDCSPSFYQYVTDHCVVSWYCLVEGCPALTTTLVHSGNIGENEANHVHILQLTGWRNTQETESMRSHTFTQTYFLHSSAVCGYFHSCTFIQRGFFVLAADFGVGTSLQKAPYTWQVFTPHGKEQSRLFLQGTLVYWTWLGWSRKYCKITYIHYHAAEHLPVDLGSFLHCYTEPE